MFTQATKLPPQQPDSIVFENHLAETMMQEALESKVIQDELHQIGMLVRTKIVAELKLAVDAKDISKPSDLSSPMQNAIGWLAVHQTATGRHWGCLLPDKVEADISNSIENIRLLLNKIFDCLGNIKQAKTINDYVQFFQALCDIFYCYVEKLHGMHDTKEYDLLYTYMWPDQEELDIRQSYKELGQQPRLSLRTGIGSELGKDLVPADSLEAKTAVTAGKAVFASVSMKTYLETLTVRFDTEAKQLQELKSALEQENKLSATNQPNPATQKKHNDLQQQHATSAKKMDQYNIPHAPQQRESLQTYVTRYLTTFEKLRAVAAQSAGHPIPLIASTSGSMARAIITLQTIGAYTDQQGKIIDLDRVQRWANCYMGFLTNGGHHSVLESAEIYNRFLDYLAIEHREKLAVLRDGNLDAKSAEPLETRLPYYVLGDYQSFLHASYAKRLMDSAASSTSLPKMITM